MPHHTPTYFIGRIQLVSPIFEGSFRLRISDELISPTASGASCTVRHAVVNLLPTCAFVPSGKGARSDLNASPSVLRSVISGKSYKAASWMLP